MIGFLYVLRAEKIMLPSLENYHIPFSMFGILMQASEIGFLNAQIWVNFGFYRLQSMHSNYGCCQYYVRLL